MKILLVDDCEWEARGLLAVLKVRGMTVQFVDNAAQAIEAVLKDGAFDCVISDLCLGPNYWGDEAHNGAHLLSRISEISPETLTILFTAQSRGLENQISGVDEIVFKQRGGIKGVLDLVDSSRRWSSPIE